MSKLSFCSWYGNERQNRTTIVQYTIIHNYSMIYLTSFASEANQFCFVFCFRIPVMNNPIFPTFHFILVVFRTKTIRVHLAIYKYCRWQSSSLHSVRLHTSKNGLDPGLECSRLFMGIMLYLSIKRSPLPIRVSLHRVGLAKFQLIPSWCADDERSSMFSQHQPIRD